MKILKFVLEKDLQHISASKNQIESDLLIFFTLEAE